MDITGLAMTSLHCQVSNREAAALASAYVGDLSRSGHLPPDASFLTVARGPRQSSEGEDRVLDEATDRGEKRSLEEDVSCISVDARLDRTKVRYFDEETKKSSPA